jgi:hypothetical protein
MATADPEGNTLHAMHFQLRYITTDFDFGNRQISVSDAARKMDFLLRKRVPEDADLPPLEDGDRFISIACERGMTERIHREAVSSGQLSIKKGAVRNVHDEMYNHLLRTMHLIRWRANSDGRPQPIRSGVDAGFRWSLDRVEWKPVADCVSFRVDVHVIPQWTSEAEEFIGTGVSRELDEPLGHELLREAWTNRDSNPRSCIVMAVAAAEVGFKQFVSKVFPDAAWILESLQSPPLVKMLTELFPWSKLRVQINGKDLTPPDSVTTTLTTAVKLRNDVVHGRVENLNRKTVHSVLTAVRDLLYFLDAAQGQRWALYHLSAEARKHFPQIASWPLLVTPVVQA